MTGGALGHPQPFTRPILEIVAMDWHRLVLVPLLRPPRTKGDAAGLELSGPQLNGDPYTTWRSDTMLKHHKAPTMDFDNSLSRDAHQGRIKP